MNKPFLAMIIPMGEAPGGSPPGIWGPTDPRPTPPIHMPPGQGGGERPPGTWGGAGEPFPTPPINLPPGYGQGRPPGTWGGAGEPFPTPPIVIPPSQPDQPPLVIWGPNDPRPTPPIELPGGGNPPPGGDRVQLVEWKTAWTEETGWIVVGVPSTPHPAPSGSGAQPQQTGRRR